MHIDNFLETCAFSLNLYTGKEIAQYFGVNPSAVANWKARGKVPSRIVMLLKKKDAESKGDDMSTAFNELLNRYEKLRDEMKELTSRPSPDISKSVTSLLPERDIMGELLDGAIEQQSLLNESSTFGFALLILDKNNNVSRINPTFTQFFGYDVDNLYGKSVLDTIVTNGDVKALEAHLSKIDINQTYLLNIQHKEGYAVPVKVRSKNITTLTYVNFNVLLFTVLKDLSDVYPGFMISEGDPVTGKVFDVPVPRRTINPYMFSEQYGYTSEEATKLNIIDLVHPTELQGAIQERNDNMKLAQDRDEQYASTDSKSTVSATTIEKFHRIKHKDGHYVKSVCLIRTHWDKKITTIQFTPDTEAVE